METPGKGVSGLTDMEKILATRHDNGADYWMTPDGKIGVGGPFSTVEILLIFSELQVGKTHEAIQGAAEGVLAGIKPDGRVQVAPKSTIYPCHSAVAAAALCRNGFGEDPRVQKTLQYLLAHRHCDGGWRCKKFSAGKGPETEHSNPGVTLWALDAFRCAGVKKYENELEEAVETLLEHWTIKIPIGPCHFGIGTQFHKIEYPFLRYNIFYYAYVLSFYRKACNDHRFWDVLEILKRKCNSEGKIVMERPNRKLAEMHFCKKGNPSDLATKRYEEIIRNAESKH